MSMKKYSNTVLGIAHLFIHQEFTVSLLWASHCGNPGKWCCRDMAPGLQELRAYETETETKEQTNKEIRQLHILVRFFGKKKKLTSYCDISMLWRHWLPQLWLVRAICVSSQPCIQWHHIARLQLAIVRVFIPRESSRATHQAFPLPPSQRAYW